MGSLVSPGGGSNPLTHYQASDTQVLVPIASTYQTLAYHAGSGYLYDSVFISDGGGTLTVRITVDGVVKYLGATGEDSSCIGIANSNKLSGDDSGASVKYPIFDADNPIYKDMAVSENHANYPYTGGGNYITTIGFPIRFESSVLIEYKQSLTTAHLAYTVELGVE